MTNDFISQAGRDTSVVCAGCWASYFDQHVGARLGAGAGRTRFVEPQSVEVAEAWMG
jgi:hypothetical protein